MIETVVSEKNPLLKEIRRAAGRGGLTEEGYSVAEGFHLLDEAVAARLEIAAVVVADSAKPALAERFSRLEEFRLVTIPDNVFAGLTTTEQPQGVIVLAKPKAWGLEQILGRDALAVVLDGVQDPGNAGAILRSAEAFGSSGVIFLKGSVNPYNPKCLRGSAGSAFRVPVVAGMDAGSLVAATHHAGFSVYAAMPRAPQLLDRVDLTKPCAIIIGGEARGVQEALTAHAIPVRIPTSGVESLNAAVACGVLLYEARRQRSRA